MSPHGLSERIHVVQNSEHLPLASITASVLVFMGESTCRLQLDTRYNVALQITLRYW